MGAEHTDRLAGLDQQGLVVFELAQGGKDLVEALPVAGGATDASVDHQALGVFRDLCVEIILQHAVGRFGQPALAGELAAAGCADNAGRIEARVGASVGRICGHGSSLRKDTARGPFPRALQCSESMLSIQPGQIFSVAGMAAVNGCC
jgi:hypothetical protein